jgi:predicted aspartyl protease
LEAFVPCQKKIMSKKVEIDIEAIEIEEENYHLFISAKAGRKKVRLLLDTGASKTVFDLEQIAEISGKKNEIHKTESVGLGASKVETSLFNLSSLSIGEIKLKNPEIAILDISHVNMAYQAAGIPQIQGILGSDILMKTKAIIDYGKLKLKLKIKE